MLTCSTLWATGPPGCGLSRPRVASIHAYSLPGVRGWPRAHAFTSTVIKDGAGPLWGLRPFLKPNPTPRGRTRWALVSGVGRGGALALRPGEAGPSPQESDEADPAPRGRTRRSRRPRGQMRRGSRPGVRRDGNLVLNRRMSQRDAL